MKRCLPPALALTVGWVVGLSIALNQHHGCVSHCKPRAICPMICLHPGLSVTRIIIGLLVGVGSSVLAFRLIKREGPADTNALTA